MTGKRTDENLLIKAAQNGDKSAENEIMQQYEWLVRAAARLYFLKGSETDDLIQEGRMGLYKAIGEFDETKGASFKNFAYMTVTHRIFDTVKKTKKDSSIVLIPLGDIEEKIYADDPLEMMIRIENNREFIKKMSGVLSDFEYRVMTMYLDGFSVAEICEATGKKAKSVYNAVAKGKKKLTISFQP